MFRKPVGYESELAGVMIGVSPEDLAQYRPYLDIAMGGDPRPVIGRLFPSRPELFTLPNFGVDTIYTVFQNPLDPTKHQPWEQLSIYLDEARDHVAGGAYIVERIRNGTLAVYLLGAPEWPRPWGYSSVFLVGTIGYGKDQTWRYYRIDPAWIA